MSAPPRGRHPARSGRATAERQLFRLGAIAAAAIIVPVFLQLSGSAIALAPSYVDRVRVSGDIVPVSVLLVPSLVVVLLVVAALRKDGRLPRPRWEDGLVVLYAAVHVAACLWGLLFGSARVPASLLLVLQALFPLGAYVLARVAVEMHGALGSPTTVADGLQRGLLVGLAIVGGTALAGYLTQTAIDGFRGWRFGLIADHIGPFYNFKMKRYFSIYLALISGALVTYALVARAGLVRALAALGGSFLGLASILVTHSRTAAGTFLVVVAIGALGVLDPLSGRVRRRGLLAIAAAVVLAAAVGVNTPVERARALVRVQQTLEALAGGGSLSRGDVTRIDRWEKGVEGSFEGVFGTAYDVRRRGPEAERVLNTESGYLDISARAGVPALLLVVVLLFVAGLRSVRNAVVARSAGDGGAVWVAWSIAGILVASIVMITPFITSLSEPYLGPTIWFVLGTLVQRREGATHPAMGRPA